MTTRREALAGLLGTAAAGALPMQAVFAATGPRPIRPAKLERAPSRAKAPFVPVGEYMTKAVDLGYVEEEWFASGVDERGRPYKTQVYVRRPRDVSKFSGTVIMETLHIHSIAAIYQYCSPYILRSGHAWVCVASQKTALEQNVKPFDPAAYASLHIEADPVPGGAKFDLQAVPRRNAPLEERIPWFREMERYNHGSIIILGQVAEALRGSSGPLAGYKPRHLLLVGHSQTGSATTEFILQGHETYRRAGGGPVFDGYFPAGHTRKAFGPRDVPIIQLLSDGDVADPNITTIPGFEGRPYRRDDSDEPNDRYRLYECAGLAHMGTRYGRHNIAANWPGIPATAKMSTLPHHEMFNMGLNHLVQWVAKGTVPPRGDRIALAPDGKSWAKDRFGNTVGGVRCAQMDIPHSTYFPNAKSQPPVIMQGTEEPFADGVMRTTHGSPANYVERFNRRLDGLIEQGWFLAEDAPGMREEAKQRRF